MKVVAKKKPAQDASRADQAKPLAGTELLNTRPPSEPAQLPTATQPRNSTLDDSDSEPEKVESSARWMLRDVPVEFLGVLLPGVLFISACIFVMDAPMRNLVFTIRSVTGTSGSFQHVSLFASVYDAQPWSVFVVLVLAAYVLGHCFFRLDPKEVDRQSFFRENESREEGGEKDNWPVRVPLDASDANVEYPYRYLREYLTWKGHHHLADLVPWKGEDSNWEVWRSKFFINKLKIRLFYHVPQRCGLLLRNEGHIRLLSSVWYAARSFAGVVMIGGGLTLLRLILHLTFTSDWGVSAIVFLVAALLILVWWRWGGAKGKRRSHGITHPRRACEIWTMFLCAVLYAMLALRLKGVADCEIEIGLVGVDLAILTAVWVITLWIRKNIEKSIHYMRVREVLFVLETAWIASKQYPVVTATDSYSQK